ncbi:hypothetical protein H632_c3834p0, partial [Helicosporidium sp. ATCC 50920]
RGRARGGGGGDSGGLGARGAAGPGVSQGPEQAHLGRAVQGPRLERHRRPGAGRQGPHGHAQPLSGARREAQGNAQADAAALEQVRPRPGVGDPPLARAPQPAVSHARLPRVGDQPLWQGRAAGAAAPAGAHASRQAARQRGARRLPKRGQELRRQRPSLQARGLGGARPGTDQSLAVRQPHQAHLPHRLPRRRPRLRRRHRHVRGAQGRRARGDAGGPYGARGRGPAPRASALPHARLPPAALGRRRGVPHAPRPRLGTLGQGGRARPQRCRQERAARLAARQAALFHAAPRRRARQVSAGGRRGRGRERE